MSNIVLFCLAVTAINMLVINHYVGEGLNALSRVLLVLSSIILLGVVIISIAQKVGL